MAHCAGPTTHKSHRPYVDLVSSDMNFKCRPYPPRQANRVRIKESEYLFQLQEKQKTRFTYGTVEKQLRRYYAETHRRPGKTGDNPIVLPESCLNDVVCRTGLVRIRRQARQLISHGHLVANGRKINASSFRVNQYDIIDVHSRSQKMIWLEEAQKNLVDVIAPVQLQVVPESLRILVYWTLERVQIDVPLQERLIVEFYSK